MARAGLGAVGAGADFAAAKDPAPGHDQDDATFDHIFGSLRTAKGLGVHWKHRQIQQKGGIREIQGFSELGPNAFKVPHGEEVLGMDRLLRGSHTTTARWTASLIPLDANENPELSFTTVDPPSNPPWGLLAEQGVVFDQYFSSSLGGSLPKHAEPRRGDG